MEWLTKECRGVPKSKNMFCLNVSVAMVERFEWVASSRLPKSRRYICLEQFFASWVCES